MSNRSDTFNRADGAIGTPSDAGSAWVNLSGCTWSIFSNAAYRSAGTPVTREGCYLEASSSQGDVQFTIVAQSTGRYPAVTGRVADNSNYLMAQVGNSYNELRLYKCVAGSFTQLGSTYTATINNTDTVTLVVAASNSLSVKHNGTVRIGPTTDSAGSSNTKWGMTTLENDLGARQDDWSFTDTASANPVGKATRVRQAVNRASTY